MSRCLNLLATLGAILAVNGLIFVMAWDQVSATSQAPPGALIGSVWVVLFALYSNTPKFMPHVVSSQVMTAKGNQKVVEQVDVRQVFFLSARSRIRSAITETAKTRIDFQAIDGDLKSLKGYWLLEPIAPYTGAKAKQMLITQVIEVQPKVGTPSGIFYNIFKESLGEIMTAIKKETERRT